MAKCYPQFQHNYNQVSRELMYNWFNKHLGLGQSEPVVEKPFVPVPPKELSVFDDQHPAPSDALDAPGLRKYLTNRNAERLRLPKDPTSLKEFQSVVGPALQAIIGDELPKAGNVESVYVGDKVERDGITYRKMLLGRKGRGEQVPAIGMAGADFDGTVVVWVHPDGKKSLFHDGKLVPAARQILDKKAAILAPDLFGTGEFGAVSTQSVDKNFAGFTFGYNRPLLAQRVHDILTAIAVALAHEKTKKVHIVGFDAAGPWVTVALGLAGDAVTLAAVDLNNFRFDAVKATSDPMMLPGAVKYGDLAGFLLLRAPRVIYAHNYDSGPDDQQIGALVRKFFPEYAHRATKASPERVVEWLVP